MGLNFGWRAQETRESIWREDDALVYTEMVGGKPVKKNRASAAALAAWEEDGDASHLRPFCDGVPQIIRVRSLSPDEIRMAGAFWLESATMLEAKARSLLLAFRIGVDFEGKESQRTPDGVEHRITVKERGVRMLDERFVQHIEQSYPGMVAFYGDLVLAASSPTEAEKKASSPPSMQTPSSAAGPSTTPATTGESPNAGAA